MLRLFLADSRRRAGQQLNCCSCPSPSLPAKKPSLQAARGSLSARPAHCPAAARNVPACLGQGREWHRSDAVGLALALRCILAPTVAPHWSLKSTDSVPTVQNLVSICSNSAEVCTPLGCFYTPHVLIVDSVAVIRHVIIIIPSTQHTACFELSDAVHTDAHSKGSVTFTATPGSISVQSQQSLRTRNSNAIPNV